MIDETKERMLKQILQQASCQHIKINTKKGIRGLKVKECFADLSK